MKFLFACKYVAIGVLGVAGLRYVIPNDVWRDPHSYPVSGPLLVFTPLYYASLYLLYFAAATLTAMHTSPALGWPPPPPAPPPLHLAYFAIMGTILTTHHMLTTKSSFSATFPPVLAVLALSTYLLQNFS